MSITRQTPKLASCARLLSLWCGRGLGADDFGFHGLLRRRSLFQLARRTRRLDRNDERLGRREEFEAGRQRNVGRRQVLVNSELSDVDLEVLGYPARGTLD